MSATTRRWIAAIAAILIGVWDGCGGLLLALGSIAGQEDPPRSPLLTARQHEAMVDVMAASEAWDPVTGAVHALSALSGPLLVLAGIALLAGVGPAISAGKTAFYIGAAVNLLQGLWSTAWYLLLWAPWMAYLETAMPPSSRRELSGGALENVMVVSLVIVVAVSLAWFLAKAALLAAGAWALREPPPAEPKPKDADVGWAP